MRAISRPRKTVAIATHRRHKQKWAFRGPSRNHSLCRNRRLPHLFPTLARGPLSALKKTKAPRGASLIRRLEPSIPRGRGPRGARILADGFESVEAEIWCV